MKAFSPYPGLIAAGPDCSSRYYTEWKVNGELHREDGPAVIGKTIISWYRRGIRHRVGGPAEIWLDCDGNPETQFWFEYGKNHRVDGPAIVRKNGNNTWYLRGAYLGENDRGFWMLWDQITPEEREDPTLLSFLPQRIA